MQEGNTEPLVPDEIYNQLQYFISERQVAGLIHRYGVKGALEIDLLCAGAYMDGRESKLAFALASALKPYEPLIHNL